MNKIYLDHSATTPLDSRVLEAMTPYFTEHFGNPGSMHSFGTQAKQAVDDARKLIAFFVGCKPEEIVFTSGGSESDNLAIRGLIAQISNLKSQNDGKGSIIKPHVITTAFEHKAVLDTVKDLEKSGVIEATYIKPNTDGLVDVSKIKEVIKDNTVLVSVMYVNNEIGTIQPIREVGEMLGEINKNREKSQKNRIYFHTDAVQALEYCQISPKATGADLMSASAHKFYGPKGVGFLYIKTGTPVKPEITGGGQERGLRAATENVPGIVGMTAAMDCIFKVRADGEIRNESSLHPDVVADDAAIRIAKLRDKLIDGILARIPNSILNGKRDHLAPHIANISFVNAEGEAILLNLDFMGIAVSTGSACTSRTLEPSHVLTAMDIPPEKAHGSIRFSLGRHTTEEEIDTVITILPNIISKLRAMSPFK